MPATTQGRRECSVCNAADFRACPCPWHKPFTDWPPAAKERLLQLIDMKGA